MTFEECSRHAANTGSGRENTPGPLVKVLLGSPDEGGIHCLVHEVILRKSVVWAHLIASKQPVVIPRTAFYNVFAHDSHTYFSRVVEVLYYGICSNEGLGVTTTERAYAYTTLFLFGCKYEIDCLKDDCIVKLNSLVELNRLPMVVLGIAELAFSAPPTHPAADFRVFVAAHLSHIERSTEVDKYLNRLVFHGGGLAVIIFRAAKR